MMKRNVAVAVLVCFLCVFTVALAIPMKPAEAETVERKPGVKPSDSVKYGDFEALWNSENPSTPRPQNLLDIDNTLWVSRTVLSVSGTTVSFEATTHYRNGTENSGVVEIDVATGVGNGNLSFVSALLGIGDPVYTTGDLALARFNATVPRAYVGMTRATNLYNVTNTSVEDSTVVWTEMFWDKVTGVLVEQFLSYSKYDESNYLVSGSLQYKMIGNNIWIGVDDSVAPVAVARESLRMVDAGTVVFFDGSGSSDNMGIASYRWNFGDGFTGEGMLTSHAFGKAGVYDVVLTVFDGKGNQGQDVLTVTVNEGPAVSRLPEFAGAAVFFVAVLLVVWYFFRRRGKG